MDGNRPAPRPFYSRGETGRDYCPALQISPASESGFVYSRTCRSGPKLLSCSPSVGGY